MSLGFVLYWKSFLLPTVAMVMEVFLAGISMVENKQINSLILANKRPKAEINGT